MRPKFSTTLRIRIGESLLNKRKQDTGKWSNNRTATSTIQRIWKGFVNKLKPYRMLLQLFWRERKDVRIRVRSTPKSHTFRTQRGNLWLIIGRLRRGALLLALSVSGLSRCARTGHSLSRPTNEPYGDLAGAFRCRENPMLTRHWQGTEVLRSQDTFLEKKLPPMIRRFLHGSFVRSHHEPARS